MKHGPIYHFPSANGELPITISLIGINYCHSNYINVRNQSRITVIGYVLTGQGRITLDNRTFRPQPGDVFLLPRGRDHQVCADPESAEPWSYIWFNIAGDLAVQLLRSYKLYDSGLVSSAAVEPLFQKAIQLAQSENAREMLNVLPVLFHQIVIRLSNMVHNRNNAYSAQVEKIKQYLDNAIQHSFDSDQLCRQIGLSYKQINRLFKQESGTTVYNYVLIRKLDSAKIMLLDTELTVNEICYRLGYADPQYFSNLFKKKTGMSPSSYRTLHRDKSRP